jgi:Fe-S-cluster containining protein
MIKCDTHKELKSYLDNIPLLTKQEKLDIINLIKFKHEKINNLMDKCGELSLDILLWAMKKVANKKLEFDTYLKTKEKEPEYICKKCGLCCRCTTVNIDCYNIKTKEYYPKYFKKKDLNPKIPEEKFIIKNWKRISRKTARKLNPYHFNTTNKYSNGKMPYYYTCKLLKDNKCSVYEERPEICRNHKPGDSSYSPDCGIKVIPDAEVGTEPRSKQADN